MIDADTVVAQEIFDAGDVHGGKILDEEGEKG